MENTDYEKAWEEEPASDGGAVVKAVAAAKEADDGEFKDAFENDNFGITPTPVKKKPATEGETTAAADGTDAAATEAKPEDERLVKVEA